MRFHPTPSEALLWSRLRGRRLGVQFRRRVVIGSYIVDFLAPAAGLVVEVDGHAYHARRFSADSCGDAKLLRAGYAVLRLPASLVTSRLDGRRGVGWPLPLWVGERGPRREGQQLTSDR